MALALHLLLPLLSEAAARGPCDIFGAAGTPCVAAHSTVRVLAANYSGPLYEVTRASDGKTAKIDATSSGFADSAAQDAFCSGSATTALAAPADPLSCFTEEPATAKKPNVCPGSYAVKLEANNPAECAAKCLADPKCVQFASATPAYADPHACRLSYTCSTPTQFLAGFDGYQRELTKAGCSLPKGGGCTITKILDQSGHGNHLTTAPAGGAHGAADNAANATALRTTLSGGRTVYGLYFERGSGPGRAHSGTGYRCDSTSQVAKDDEPETIYMVVAGKRYNAGCCFDYGNAETDNHADGKGAMEAVVRHKHSPPPPSSSASSPYRFQADRCHLTHTGAK